MISSSWYTPDYIWDKVNGTLTDSIYDPFPRNHMSDLSVELWDGYKDDWISTLWCLGSWSVYCNPPIPASKAAIKAIETHKTETSTNIIFAGYSEAVIWQVPELETYIHVKCPKRINWIDGREEVKVKNTNVMVSNPNYLKPGRNPAHYSSFFLLSEDALVIQRFIDNFSDLGTIKHSIIVQ